MLIDYLIIFIFTIFLSLFFTFSVKKIAIASGIIDKPDMERKRHKQATPLLGGLSIFLSFFIVLYFSRDYVLAGDLEPSHWLGVFIGAGFLMIGGLLDDKYNLNPSWQIIFPILAALAVAAGGVGIEKITNPFGGFFYFDIFKFPLISWTGKIYYLAAASNAFTVLWLAGMMYTTKLLDGLDGLVAGIITIGAFIIFLFTMTTKYYQPDMGLASLILAGACLGFLIFNWHPAKIFLGEGGSLFLGFILGVLAIISGGKIAIALLIIGIPIMDVIWTIIRRLLAGKNPFSFSDRQHLHFRLHDSGLGTKKTVLIYYCLSFFFGLSALFLQSQGKLLALGVLVLIMLAVVICFRYLDKNKQA
jgi:UDP-GlcNAc:undecaprenyl-phosphate GlcNAc-1-phosphate transferase